MSLSIPDFAGLKVLVVGDLMLDQYWFGPTSRISPEAPVPVVQVRRSETRPGGAANVAINLTSLGVQASISGLIGDDEGGKELTSLLENAGVQTALSRSPRNPTISKLRGELRSRVSSSEWAPRPAAPMSPKAGSTIATVRRMPRSMKERCPATGASKAAVGGKASL